MIEVRKRRDALKKIEDHGAQLEEKLILDNKYISDVFPSVVIER